MTRNADAKSLYRALVLGHARAPHNFRRMADATHRAEGHNPLCGDRVSLYLRMRDSRVEDVAFEGTGCAISIASASMLTDMLKGSTAEAAGRVADGGAGAAPPAADGPIASLAEVRAFPTRIRCATLPWQTFRAALQCDPKPSSTEPAGAG
jgi:nitrogen fixation protein NifU and related proteins